MQNKIHNLVLCGGGFFGYAQVGALKELENYKEYLDLTHIKGVSVGSIVAALYAIDYTPDELSNILFELDFDKLIRDNYLPYYRIYEKYGQYDAIKLEEEIERLIRIKTNIKFCTFSQIKRNLTIISTNLNYQCAKFLNRETSPNMPVSKAVRMSIGYPGYISPVLYEGDLYGDGGESINYPIFTFGNLNETIGIVIVAFNENSDGTLNSRVPINNIYDYIMALGQTLSRSAYISQIKKEHLDRSIKIKITENITSMQFNLTPEQKKIIFECGVKATREQIKQILRI